MKNDPATDSCSLGSIVDCEAPLTLASGVLVEAYNSTAVNSDIFFQCQQPGLVPSYRSATCGSDGRWSPDPSHVECRMITPTIAGTPAESISTHTTMPNITSVSTGIVTVHRYFAGCITVQLVVLLCYDTNQRNYN